MKVETMEVETMYVETIEVVAMEVPLLITSGLQLPTMQEASKKSREGLHLQNQLSPS